MKITIIRAVCVFCFCGILSAWYAVTSRSTELVFIHSVILAHYETVEHIEADDYAALDINNLVVFDVREPEEFAVSHLDGAIQIDPDMTPNEFSEEINNITDGKTVVFYCSVGWRSSELAERVDSVLKEHGLSESYNLTGGLFQWHNENRPLTSNQEIDTNAIHPYNSYWGQLIDDQSAVQYSRP